VPHDVVPRDLIRAFAHRPYSEISDAKLRRWVAEYRAGGSALALDRAAVLYEHARSVRPFPSAAERDADLAHHVELRNKLDRTAHVVPVR
jgi:hypothetical protein